MDGGEVESTTKEDRVVKPDAFKIELGEKVKDCVTGFKGVVIARAQYITGCNQYGVAPKAVKNEAKDSRWFDEDRLIDSIPKKKTKRSGNRGGPQSDSAPLK